MSLTELAGSPKAATYAVNVPSAAYTAAVATVQSATKGTVISKNVLAPYSPSPSLILTLPKSDVISAVDAGLVTGLVNQTKLPLRPIDVIGIGVMTAGAGALLGGALLGGEAAVTATGAVEVAGAGAAAGAGVAGGSVLGAGALTTGAILAATLPGTIATVAKVGLGAGILDYLQKNPWVIPVGFAGIVAILLLRKK
jgi:hypothetical protein